MPQALPSSFMPLASNHMLPGLRKAPQVWAVSSSMCWYDIKFFSFPCKYLKQKKFQAPSSSLENYWSCFSGQAEDFTRLCITHVGSVGTKQRPVGNGGLLGSKSGGFQLLKYENDFAM